MYPSDYDGNNEGKALKNFGAFIGGALNSIESATSSTNYSGVANAIVGTANRTFNSSGSLIFWAKRKYQFGKKHLNPNRCEKFCKRIIR